MPTSPQQSHPGNLSSTDDVKLQNTTASWKLYVRSAVPPAERLCLSFRIRNKQLSLLQAWNDGPTMLLHASEEVCSHKPVSPNLLLSFFPLNLLQKISKSTEILKLTVQRTLYSFHLESPTVNILAHLLSLKIIHAHTIYIHINIYVHTCWFIYIFPWTANIFFECLTCAWCT